MGFRKNDEGTLELVDANLAVGEMLACLVAGV